MNQVLWKDVVREIRHSLPRFLSIIAIIMLGVAFFIGIRAAGPSMLDTSRAFYHQHQMPHGWVQGTYGLNQEDMNVLKQADKQVDWLAMTTVQASIHPGNETLKVFPWSNKPQENFFHVVAGRAPQASGEIVLDDQYQQTDVAKEMTFKLGDELTLSMDDHSGQTSQPHLQQETYKVVGFVESPLYFERTARGMGAEDGFAAVVSQDITGDIYTEAYFWQQGLSNQQAFSDEWEDVLTHLGETLEDALKSRPDQRLIQVKTLAQEDIDQGQKDIDQGYHDLRQGKSELEQAKETLEENRQKLHEAQSELEEGQQELQSGQDKYAQGLVDAHKGEKDLKEAEATLKKHQEDYQQGEKEYQAGLKAYQDQLAQGLKDLKNQQAKIDAQAQGLASTKQELDQEQANLDNQWKHISQETGLSVDQIQAGGMDPGQYQAQRQALESQIADLQAQVPLSQKQSDLQSQLALLEDQEASLQTQIAALTEDGTQADHLASLQAELTQILTQKEQVMDQLAQIRPLADIQADIQAAKADLEQLVEQYQGMRALMQEMGPQIQALKDGQVRLDQAWAKYHSGKQAMEEGQAQLNQAWVQYRQQENSLPQPLQEAKDKLAQAKQELDQGQVDLKKGKEAAKTGQDKLAQAFLDLESGRRDWAKGRQKYEEGMAEWLDGQADYQAGEKDYQEAYPQAIADLEKGQKDLDQARKDLRNLLKPQYMVSSTVDDDVYQGIANNAKQLNVIANIFPVFFLAIAVLVTYSTIKRMTQEQRNYMGTLKQLGYSDQAILSKFLVYAGLAATLGIILGLIVGYRVFPPVVLAAYNIMYHFNQPVVHYAPGWMAVIALIAYLTAFIPAYFSPKKLLDDAPVNLLRPQAPRSGNKTFIENWQALWRRLSFKRKMTVRNLLRYKGRNLMTMLGVAGCTMLIVTGYGISNTISGIVSEQFDRIHTYDAFVIMDQEASQTDRMAVQDFLSEDSGVQAFVPMSQQSVETDLKGIPNQTVTVLMPMEDDWQNFETYFQLNERTSPEKHLTIPKGQVIITERLEEFVHSRNKETLPFVYDGLKADLTVSAVTENYVGHYMYMHAQDFQEAFKEKPKLNAFYVDYKGHPSQELRDQIADLEGVLTTLNIEDTAEGLQQSLGSLDLITLVLVISAAGLAFIVLYNLTNINIAERMKELATIKVLGFYSKEVSLYIYDEILVLTFLGASLGLIFGYGLTYFIMKTMQLNNVLFYPRVHWDSYLYSFALTFVFSGIVMFIMHRKIRQIDMVEALKAVE